ncbi:MAG: UDP-N-acetylglucosamine transferase subunit [Friedmanniella sp.]|nr:UDP-N-acetylglucosamine transferase subunit [Friedmanniella sp.]
MSSPAVTPFYSSELSYVPPGAKVLFVTSTGGHLSELSTIGDRLKASPDSLWVTHETPQAVGFLSGHRRHYVDYVAPRDLRGALRAAASVSPVLRRESFDLCVSTGAAVAGTVLPMAALAGIPTYYVESLARPTGPSFTGKLLARTPRVHTLSQYPAWSSPAWPCTESVLDGWQVSAGPRVDGPLRILVTLGTIRPYRFDRAVEAVRRILRPGDEIVWQLGATTRHDLPGQVLREVSQAHLSSLARAADVVVAHSGVGSILQQFELGKSPVLAVRSVAHGEHVDEHQRGFADTTAARGLTSVLDLDAPDRAVLERAAGCQVTSSLRVPAGAHH